MKLAILFPWKDDIANIVLACCLVVSYKTLDSFGWRGGLERKMSTGRGWVVWVANSVTDVSSVGLQAGAAMLNESRRWLATLFISRRRGEGGVVGVRRHRWRRKRQRCG